MWFTAVDIASTPGGHAGMHRSQPLQCSTSIVTVPRLLTLMSSDMCVLPCRRFARRKKLLPGAERPLVCLDVLCAIRRNGCAHRGHECIVADDPRRRAECTEHDHRPGKRASEVG